MGYAHEYLDSVLRRNRVGMPPIGFTPNWADKPRHGKYYPHTQAVELPEGAAPETATLAEGLRPPAEAGVPFDLDLLGGVLRDSYGWLGRRLAVHANGDLAALPIYATALWSRGTASGGGLYPVSVYWVSGRSGPMAPGVHYYDTMRHAMRRLLTGDVSGEVRAALDCPELAGDTDQFLVLGIKYWQNSFKYNSFSYHSASMDIGTAVQTMRMLARARGADLRPAFFFDEQRINDLLGTVSEDEGVYAVIPLPWAGATPTEPPGPGSQVRAVDAELSRTIVRFEALDKMHASTKEGAADRPDPAVLAECAARPPRAGELVPLGQPAPLPGTVRAALRARRSSFGRFAATDPLPAETLAAVLAAGAAAARLPSDVGAPALTKLYAFAQHVDGVPPAAYEYDPQRSGLVRLERELSPGFVQRNYFLDNYNTEQAGAVLVVSVRATALLAAVGDRGYRLATAAVGAVAQAVYTACAALGIGCGAALGFDNISYADQLRLSGSDEAPLLIIMIGHERAGVADYNFQLCAGTR
jgi:SagB-type dehydrogenase family enzyme